MNTLSPLVQTIVQRLRALAESTHSPSLPPMRECAKSWGVSTSTVIHAARVLREEGVLSFTRGRGMQVVARLVDTPVPQRNSARVSLEKRLTGLLASGEYRTGQPLPKVSFLSAQFHASNSTVTVALYTMQKKGLVHKRGKFWITGPREERSGNIRITSQPRVILVLQDREDEWEWLARLGRTGRFCSHFVAEAERYGVSLIGVFTTSSQTMTGMQYAGVQRIESLVHSLGSRYQGTLVLSSLRELPDVADWIRRFCGYGKPVVWFDRYDIPPKECRFGSCFTRCRFSEADGCSLAMRTLADAGHRELLYPISAPGFMEWQFHRRDLLTAVAQHYSCTVTPVSYMVNDISRNPEQSEEGTIESYEPLFTRMRVNRRATAIIAPNDYTAAMYYRRYALEGVRFPQDLSLVSFDNSIATSLLPVSTIDFGLGYLGYAAFHTIFNALPVQHAHGVITSRPRLVDRGSLGPPRTGLLWTMGISLPSTGTSLKTSV